MQIDNQYIHPYGGWGKSEVIGHEDNGKFLVSTVLPHDRGGKYESMVFERNDDDSWNWGSPVFTEHYDSREKAEEGHDRLVRKYLNN